MHIEKKERKIQYIVSGGYIQIDEVRYTLI